MSAASTHPLTQAIESSEERVKNYKTEREQLVAELRSVMASAGTLLSDLGETVGGPAGRRRGRPPGTGKRGTGRRKKGGRRKGFKMSAEAKAKIAAAQKKRWAKQRAEEKK